MNAGAWVVLIAGAAAALGFAFWIYSRREVPVDGRPLLVAARAATLALLLLLLLDPVVPGAVGAGRDARVWVALDLSLSMNAGPAGEPTPWERAAARARELRQEGATVLGFGDGLRVAAEDDAFLEGSPGAATTRLAPLLERALEAGAAEVVVLSDLRLEDAQAVRAVLDGSPLPVRFEDLGTEVANAGIARWELPASVSPGEAVAGVLEVFGSASAAGRSAALEVREEGRLVHSAEVVLPAPGGTERVEVSLPAPGARGLARYEARVSLAGDVLPDDDQRVRYVTVDPEEGLLVAVAQNPDWELRFLLPVLEQVTGLTARGYVRVGPERYLPAAGGGAQTPVDVAEVRRRVEAAELLVLQGLSGADPEWIRRAAVGARRALVLPADASGAAVLGVTADAPLSGEWYVTPELPASSIVRDLAGGPWQGLPPLDGVLLARGELPGEAPLRLQVRSTGPGEPALLLLRGAGGRRALTLASGFWRWGFREGPPRQAYRRLWAGVAGWLLSDATVAGGAAIRPLERVVARGQPIEWAAPGLAGQEVRVTLTGAGGETVDTVLQVGEDGVARSAPPPPGEYGYRASSPAREEAAEGRLDVERYTEELRHLPARDLLEQLPSSARSAGGRSGGRPLRTHPLPYLLLLGLLCGEWIGRRRRGLR